jgi:hypothetical protein
MICKTLLLGALSLMAVSVSAATLPTPKTHTFSLGLEGGHAHYWDWFDNGQPYQDIGGLTGGVMADYTLTLHGYFAKVDVHAQWGKAKYSATVAKGIAENVKGTLRNARTNMVDTRLVVGRHFDVREDLRIAPFVGVGYKTFNRANLAGRFLDSDPSIAGVMHYSGEDFRTHHIYLPIGATVTKALDDTWHFSATGEIDILLNGNVSQKTENTPSIKVPQRRGFGIKTELSIARQLDKMTLSVGPYFNFWTVKKKERSDDNAIALMNRSIETGLRIKFSF